MACAAFPATPCPLVTPTHGTRSPWPEQSTPCTTWAALTVRPGPNSGPSRCSGCSRLRPRFRSRHSAPRQSQHLCGDDVALDLGCSTGDGAAETSGITLEPTDEIMVQVHVLIGTRRRGVSEPIGPRGGQCVLERLTLRLGAAQLQYRHRRGVHLPPRRPG